MAWQPGYPDLVANSPLLGMVAQSKCFEDGSIGAVIIDELAPQAGDAMVTHQRVGGFHGSELDTILRGAGIDTVVVSDACSAGSEAARTASLESLGLLAEITTDELFSALAPQPAGVGA